LDGEPLALALTDCQLSDFNLASSLSHTDTTFRRFSTQSHMLLNANTLANLEVYRNADDNGEKGSLLWLLAGTATKMGKRQLREWVGRPLVDKACALHLAFRSRRAAG
jgi:DNA mismatch repair protein MSH3